MPPPLILKTGAVGGNLLAHYCHLHCTCILIIVALDYFLQRCLYVTNIPQPLSSKILDKIALDYPDNYSGYSTVSIYALSPQPSLYDTVFGSRTGGWQSSALHFSTRVVIAFTLLVQGNGLSSVS